MKRLSIADIKASEILSKEEKKNLVGGYYCDANLGVRCVPPDDDDGSGDNVDGCFECKILSIQNGFLQEKNTYVLMKGNCSGQLGKHVETYKCFH